ncbi:unnamed protein product [Protopolystoma xenopodis]|uniref:Uncharacterized protein n=1 Tax=Protopolystoma xenopodis TaxID=117903 RepID=A0A3S5B474_9PLAT|nr:unnamed protein product [Protopolystoma xenopodis]
MEVDERTNFQEYNVSCSAELDGGKEVNFMIINLTDYAIESYQPNNQSKLKNIHIVFVFIILGGMQLISVSIVIFSLLSFNVLNEASLAKGESMIFRNRGAGFHDDRLNTPRLARNVGEMEETKLLDLYLELQVVSGFAQEPVFLRLETGMPAPFKMQNINNAKAANVSLVSVPTRHTSGLFNEVTNTMKQLVKATRVSIKSDTSCGIGEGSSAAAIFTEFSGRTERRQNINNASLAHFETSEEELKKENVEELNSGEQIVTITCEEACPYLDDYSLSLIKQERLKLQSDLENGLLQVRYQGQLLL